LSWIEIVDLEIICRVGEASVSAFVVRPRLRRIEIHLRFWWAS
jgi:hypothetical protein